MLYNYDVSSHKHWQCAVIYIIIIAFEFCEVYLWLWDIVNTLFLKQLHVRNYSQMHKYFDTECLWNCIRLPKMGISKTVLCTVSSLYLQILITHVCERYVQQSSLFGLMTFMKYQSTLAVCDVDIFFLCESILWGMRNVMLVPVISLWSPFSLTDLKCLKILQNWYGNRILS